MFLLLSLPVAAGDYEDQIEAWHQQRLAKLQEPYGWLSLVGLHWLGTQERTLEGIGKARLDGQNVVFDFEPGVTLAGREVATASLGPDRAEGQDLFSNGTLQFHVIRRGDRVGVRVKNSESKARANFAGIERFPVDPEWRIEGRIEVRPAEVKTGSVVGVTTSEKSPGYAVFEKNGEQKRMLLMGEPGEERFFLVFADETSGKSTYSACRFLYVERQGKDGRILDFNKAYNPPCAFTPYATCPLPYPENLLDFSVEAGEKKPY